MEHRRMSDRLADNWFKIGLFVMGTGVTVYLNTMGAINNLGESAKAIAVEQAKISERLSSHIVEQNKINLRVESFITQYYDDRKS